MSALDGGERSASHTGRFNPGERVGGGEDSNHQIGDLASPRAVQRVGEEKSFLAMPGTEIDLQNGKTVTEINGNNIWIW